MTTTITTPQPPTIDKTSMLPESTYEMIPSLHDGTKLCVHSWVPKTTTSSSNPIRGIIIIYHGFLAHARYPTVKYAAELFVSNSSTTTNSMMNNNQQQQQMIVVAADMRGHGLSEGLRGYVPDRDTIINDAIQIYEHTQLKYNNNTNHNNNKTTMMKPLKVFLLGSSMGGTIALTVAHEVNKRIQQQQQQQQNNTDCTDVSSSGNTGISGVILVAPMFKLKVDTIAQKILSGLSYVIPTLSIIPSSSTDNSKQYRDLKKRLECENDPFLTKGNKTIRVGSAQTCIDLVKNIQTLYHEITVPYLLLIADEDVIVEPDTTLFDTESSSTSPDVVHVDKECIHYPALHGLLCEPQPLLGTIQKDIIQWIQKRL